jgi:hypothetical protein
MTVPEAPTPGRLSELALVTPHLLLNSLTLGYVKQPNLRSGLARSEAFRGYNDKKRRFHPPKRPRG